MKMKLMALLLVGIASVGTVAGLVSTGVLSHHSTTTTPPKTTTSTQENMTMMGYVFPSSYNVTLDLYNISPAGDVYLVSYTITDAHSNTFTVSGQSFWCGVNRECFPALSLQDPRGTWSGQHFVFTHLYNYEVTLATSRGSTFHDFVTA